MSLTDEFLKQVGAAAVELGLSPSTLVQRAARRSGGDWAAWSAGDASPSLRTADRILVAIDRMREARGVGDDNSTDFPRGRNEKRVFT